MPGTFVILSPSHFFPAVSVSGNLDAYFECLQLEMKTLD